MGVKTEQTSYGFGQMGSVHGKTRTPLIPPKGMVICAIQFLADNTLIKLVSESQGTLGKGANFIDTETEAKFNFNGVTESNTIGAATIAAGAAVAITADPKVKVGQYVLLINNGDTNTSGVTIDATTLVPNYADGFLQGTKVLSVNAAGTSITLSESITFDGAQNMVFIDECNGVGGQDASSIIYPKGMVIYGRWTEVMPTADADGGIICYYGY